MIAYTYEIVSIDNVHKVMEVKYSAEGYSTINVGIIMPTVDQDLNTIIGQYAPINLWENEKVVRQDITLGQSGEMVFDREKSTADTIATHQMWEQIAFEQRVAAILVKFGVLKSDPTTIPVTKL